MTKKAFSLIEVIVAMTLIVIIGLTLAEISSQNINTIQSAKEDKTYLHSLALNSTNMYKNIKDYSNIKDIPIADYTIEKSTKELGMVSFELIDGFSFEFFYEEIIIKDAYEEKSYFAIK